MGERNFGLDSLKSMNRDMEDKGIGLRELSCQTATELPPPELPASAAVQLPEYTRRSSRTAGRFGGSPAEKTARLPPSSPPPELLVRWSTES
ncbi:unnamed protein product [Boreogadus saida]